MKKLLSLLFSTMITVSMFSTVVLADYSEVGGTKTWDFAEYTTVVKATQNPKTTTYAEVEPYHGLRIYLAVNNDRDYVDAKGIHFGGKMGENKDDGSCGRYMTFTPTENGVLSVTGECSDRWGIIDVLGGNFNGSDGSSAKTNGTVKMNCIAGHTYYLYGRDKALTVTSVKFVPNQVVINKTKTFTEQDGYEGNATAVMFTVNPGETTISGIDVTYGDTTKSIKTPSISGNGTVLCGIIVPAIVTSDDFGITVK